MEIDLNVAVCDEMEKEKNACASSSSSSSSSSLAFASSLSSSSSSSSSSLYSELWHACAGPVANQTKKGDLVVYFPRRHLGHARFSPTEKPFDLPPRILCKVVDLQLIANKENDEVHTQLSLHPMQQMVGLNLGGQERKNNGVDEGGNAKSTSHMFCKTLTASDTSTHGGFSVPRRAAEDCFPPLNYKEEKPSQELVATDLHGAEWRFRHIYRGQPRRHLLTTGWSIFVSQKNLASGDAVLFLRGESGELRLGIRRAARPRDGLHNCYLNNLSHVENAISSNGMFNLVYSPRENHSDFIIPYHNYLKSSASTIPIGTRFKMEYNLDDDSPERMLNSKRLRSNLQGSQKVLQGQENAGFASPVRRQTPPTTAGFVEFPKVLQGQEICSFRSLTGCSLYKAYQFPAPTFYPLASKGARNIPFFFNSHARNPILTRRATRSEATRDVGRVLHFANDSRVVEGNLHQKLALRRCLFD